MPVIAGTTKESVINKAREVLIAKKIPYTIKKSKTWFWVSSTKPTAAQTALREAGLEMNPITTMHSIWCTKCGAIRTFKKRAGDWICQKCGARLLMFKNPKKTKAMVHPEAIESLARYKDDLKAGHTSAAEYWRGQAGAYFTANPKIPKIGEFYPEFDKDTGLYCVFHTETGDFAYSSWASMGQATQDASRRNRELHNKKVDIGRYKCPVCGGTMRDTGKSLKCSDCGQVFPYTNPLSKRESKFLLDLAKKDIKASNRASLEGYPKIAQRLANQATGLRRAVYIMGPKTVAKKLEKQEWPDLNPLTKSEKQEIVNLANTQFAISRKYSDDPVRSSFWYGRSVGMGKIAKMYNPKVKKWDPVSEAIEEDEEEDDMIGAEINPLAAISSAAITGVGLGIGFKSVDWMAKKMKKNPVKPHTTAMVSKLPKCDFCARIAHYDGKTVMGPWTYMCEPHFEMYGVGLGLGKGQILIVKDRNPKGIPIFSTYCRKCKKHHRVGSKIYKEHLLYYL